MWNSSCENRRMWSWMMVTLITIANIFLATMLLKLNYFARNKQLWFYIFSVITRFRKLTLDMGKWQYFMTLIRSVRVDHLTEVMWDCLLILLWISCVIIFIYLKSWSTFLVCKTAYFLSPYPLQSVWIALGSLKKYTFIV